MEFSILVVEDDAANREILAGILPRKFPRSVVYTADSGGAGFDSFLTHRPDIVITDINMPVMNGVEMSRKIRSIKPEARFIFLTGDSGRSFLEDWKNSGRPVDRYLQKPVLFQELFSAIEECLAGIGRNHDSPRK